ncbi:Cytidylate kinase [bacterium HR36]|uniref:Cytidylate kinase n=1 Tax=uncultured Planctomycetota bacterium TaxID=120965 RepID=H5SJQ3_9BACT|nr:cytidylate kinase [uncultured Planctomycetota bacterium]GBD36955.1 Cytidylate kinase [bacterium HR36]
MIITIDGPAGAGKSTVARKLAERLGFTYLDTGAMYRAVALAALRAHISPTDEQALANLLSQLRLEWYNGRIFLDGEDVSEQIRQPVITELARRVADSPTVRAFLGHLQRHIAQQTNLVTEGRDQGTKIFPHAECKFFLTASPEVRAWRRWQELQNRGIAITYEEVLRQQHERDQQDAARALAPLQPAADAILVDTSQLPIDAVVELLLAHVRQRLGWPEYPEGIATDRARPPS